MSYCSNLRAAGLSLLRSVDGETLAFRTGSVLAVVDREPEREVDRQRIDFAEHEASVIEILRTALPTAPMVGETFEDAFGAFHRIKKVLPTDNTWRCDCDVAQP